VHLVCQRNEPKSLLSIFLAVFLAPLVISVVPFIRVSFAGSFAIYWTFLVVSTTSYRLSPFHPLAKYPGPVLARISRLWAAKQSSSGKQHLTNDELHKRYGDVIRTGPNHLHFRDADAIPVVMGARNQWHKAAGT
jgi:hypothetical protein